MAQVLIQLHALLQTVLGYGIQIYQFALLAYVLMSWLPGAYESKLGYYLHLICEPYLGIFRRFIPPLGGISFAPIVAFIALRYLGQGASIIITFVLDTLLRVVIELGIA